jgi:tRNA threonylcarbamoyladenosine biosynthesis protein TsaE
MLKNTTIEKTISLKNIEKFAEIFADFLQVSCKPCFIFLDGGLGAGKTTLISAIAKSTGVLDIVNSPTYSIVHEHKVGELHLFHCDFYRLESENEIDELGLFDNLPKNSLVFIEWASKFTKKLNNLKSIKIKIVDKNQTDRVLKITSALYNLELLDNNLKQCL